MLPPPKRLKAGTPAGLQEERALKAILPASTSSLSFFMISLAHDFRLGLARSPIGNVGCLPWVMPMLKTWGWAGSVVMGLGEPGTAMNSPCAGPTVHPIPPEEKSGVGCAAPLTIDTEARTAHAPASSPRLEANPDICFPLSLVL